MVPEKYQEVLNKAKTGDVNAQMKLGLLYYSGVGLKKNYQSALHWFKIAAEKDIRVPTTCWEKFFAVELG